MTYDLKRAIEIAKEAHRGQKSLYNKNIDFYWAHPHKVMRLASHSRPNHDKIKYRMVAVLHDVIEDTKWTIEDLRKEGIPEDILEAVDLLTHKDGVTYEDYLVPIKDNELARRVKVADMLSNMQFFYSYNREHKMEKYLNGVKFLMNKEAII